MGGSYSAKWLHFTPDINTKPSMDRVADEVSECAVNLCYCLNEISKSL